MGEVAGAPEFAEVADLIDRDHCGLRQQVLAIEALSVDLQSSDDLHLGIRVGDGYLADETLKARRKKIEGNWKAV